MAFLKDGCGRHLFVMDAMRLATTDEAGQKAPDAFRVSYAKGAE